MLTKCSTLGASWVLSRFIAGAPVKLFLGRVGTCVVGAPGHGFKTSDSICSGQIYFAEVAYHKNALCSKQGNYLFYSIA